ncbi:MAG: TetR/AcrR family transcriptional regulator [Microthrixaceae bacterium]
MPPTATPSRRAAALPPEERRAAIIEATLPLLIEHGEMVTTRQIAEAAGIAEGTIFRVFADKDELLSATLEAALDPAPIAQALATIDPDAPFEERLVEATAIYQRRVVDLWQLVSNLGSKLRAQAARPLTESAALAAIFEPAREHLTVDPRVAERLLRVLTLSVTHPMLAAEPMGPAEIVALLLRGIEARP